jgi:hypothetical protein
MTFDPGRDLSAAVELRSWYEASLRPRLARAARLGLVDEGRLQMLDRDLSALTGSEPRPSLETAARRPPRARRALPRSAYDGPSRAGSRRAGKPERSQLE